MTPPTRPQPLVLCGFLVRSEDSRPDDIHPCGRTVGQHPVVGRGRYEDHRNFRPPFPYPDPDPRYVADPIEAWYRYSGEHLFRPRDEWDAGIHPESVRGKALALMDAQADAAAVVSRGVRVWVVIAVLIAIAIALFVAAPRPGPDQSTIRGRELEPGLAGAPRLGVGAPPSQSATEPPSAGMAGRAAVPAPVGDPPAAIGTPMCSAMCDTHSGVIGPLVSGTASHVGRQFGRRYLALPEHRWGRPGIRVRICGDGGCVVRTSTDAGPDLAMQRLGRIADMSAFDFEIVCGCPASRGLTRVTVENLGDAPALPATDEETP